MIVCVGRMFFVSEIFKHFCNLKKKKKNPPPSLCYVVKYVRSMILCKLCEKAKSKRRNYLSRNVNCLFLDCKRQILCLNYERNLFYVCFLFLQSTDSILWKRKKEMIKLKRMSICFFKRNKIAKKIWSLIKFPVQYNTYVFFYPVFNEIHHR